MGKRRNVGRQPWEHMWQASWKVHLNVAGGVYEGSVFGNPPKPPWRGSFELVQVERRVTQDKIGNQNAKPFLPLLPSFPNPFYFWRSWRKQGQGYRARKGRGLHPPSPFLLQSSQAPGLICEGSLLTSRWVLEYCMEHCILITQLRWFCDLKYLEDFSLPWRLKIWWNLPDSPSRVEKDVVPENWFKWVMGLGLIMIAS